MSNIEVILKATDILTALTVTDIRELLPYQTKLEDALQALQRGVEAARTIQLETEQFGSTTLISSSASSSSSTSRSPQPPAEPDIAPQSTDCGNSTLSDRPVSHSTPPSTSRSPQLPAEPDIGPQSTDCGSSTLSDRPVSHSTPPSTSRSPQPPAEPDTAPQSTDCGKEKENPHAGASSLLSFLDDKKRSEKIRVYLSPPDYDPIGGMFDWTAEDPRVVDLRLGSGPNQSFDVKFRRGLSQRSLAAEYTQWEEATFKTSRVTQLSQNPAEASDDRKGHIDQFLDANAHRFKDQNSTRHGIKHGIRLLVFESIYGYVGVSAILILVYSAFRSVNYKDYITTKNSLENSAWESLARDKSCWLMECQEEYDARVRMWNYHQASWRATYGGTKRQRTEGNNPPHRQSPSPHELMPDTTAAEGDHASDGEEIRTSPNEPNNNMTPFPEGVLCMSTEFDPSFHIQPINYSMDVAPQSTETTSAVLDPSSHAGIIDLAFPELDDLLQDSINIGNRSESLDTSSLDPSSHAQNIHFTTLNPTEHVQSCGFGRLSQLYASSMPATYLDPRSTLYPSMNIADVSSASVGATAHQSETITQDFPPEHNNQHIYSMGCTPNHGPEVELRTQQINTPNDTDRPVCSQSTSTWQQVYQPRNFMVPV